ncbi:hypothetical protein GP486_008281, partial [Trichoglossum hirsutum]
GAPGGGSRMSQSWSNSRLDISPSRGVNAGATGDGDGDGGDDLRPLLSKSRLEEALDSELILMVFLTAFWMRNDFMADGEPARALFCFIR